MQRGFAVAILFWKPCSAKEESTDVTNSLNLMIAPSTVGKGAYRGGGSGVMVRAEDFEDSSDADVVAATFWSNDIYSPSQFYPTAGNPWFPNNGWDGFSSTHWMQPDGPAGAAGPWTYAALGVVVGTGMKGLFPHFADIQKDDWGWGVFYPTDSNAGDKRCHWWDDHQGYDCPGGWLDGNGFIPTSDQKGAGNYPMGNPAAGGGGGAGCHFDTNRNDIDQQDSYEKENLVGTHMCECNYNLGGNAWGDWVSNFINSGKQKPNFEDRTWLHGGDLAPVWAIDTAICWVNNPRDMIQMQNALFWARTSWNNHLIPDANWYSTEASEQRKYWGWNEVPASKEFIENPMNWDTIMIKLPAAVCNNVNGDWGKTDGPDCLGYAEKQQLETDIDAYVQKGKLKLGSKHLSDRPGSYIVFVREYADSYGANGEPGLNWQRHFFCAPWQSPNGKYKVEYLAPGILSSGKCFLDQGSTLSV